MKFKIEADGTYVLLGRGELHLSVFLETLRREGFEMSVGKPKVITKEVDGVEMEPIEELTIDVENESVGAVKSELGKRRGVLMSQEELTSKSSRLIFEITTRGILGLRGVLLTLTKGTAVLSSMFTRYEKIGAALPKLRKGATIASHSGRAVPYGLVGAHDKGIVFIAPMTNVYQGMIVGLNGRDDDLEINVTKEKQLTNNRSVGEEGIIIPPPIDMSLEQYLGLLEDDELLEITPLALRLRKKILDPNVRRRTANRA